MSKASDDLLASLRSAVGRAVSEQVERMLIVRVFSQVEYRDYRLDLLVVDAFGMRVAIECDGHDFHERTKAQARHDRRRDRTLTRDGLCFLRFTGSELFENTLGCAREVFDVLDEELTREMGR